MAILVAIGLSSAFGVPYGPVNSILPFLLLGMYSYSLLAQTTPQPAQHVFGTDRFLNFHYRWTWIWRTTVRRIFAYDRRYAWSQSDAYRVFVICIWQILHMTDQFSWSHSVRHIQVHLYYFFVWWTNPFLTNHHWRPCCKHGHQWNLNV